MWSCSRMISSYLPTGWSGSTSPLILTLTLTLTLTPTPTPTPDQVWLHLAATAFRLPGSEASQRSRGVVGISLYTPRLDEISVVPHQRRWPASLHVAAPAYLMQLPSSWGALYFSSALRRFEAFYRQVSMQRSTQATGM